MHVMQGEGPVAVQEWTMRKKKTGEQVLGHFSEIWKTTSAVQQNANCTWSCRKRRRRLLQCAARINKMDTFFRRTLGCNTVLPSLVGSFWPLLAVTNRTGIVLAHWPTFGCRKVERKLQELSRRDPTSQHCVSTMKGHSAS